MSPKLKSIVSPGLVNLIILEFAFLLLAVYVGLCLWSGFTATGNDPGVDLVVGVILVLSALRARK